MAPLVLHVDVGAGGDERRQERGAAVPSGEVQRRVVVLVADVERAAGRQESLYRFDLAVARRLH